MNKLLISLSVSLFFISNTNAQNTTIEYLDINNVRAGILTHGDMFWNIDSQKASYEFPKGSGLNSGFVASLWVSGIDTGSNLHVSAQTYRQNGNDYWPGPLGVGLIDSITSNNWDKIWKVNQSTIDSFQTINPHTVFNTSGSILEWPAKGNIYATGKNNATLTITTDMAPFVDVNNDGIYNALDGDYPKIKGEQALWWVFNDQKIHMESGGLPFNLQFKAMAYACNSIPALQNVTFYSYDITNASPLTYTQTRIGIFTDIDLGYSFDDYIGIDTTRRMSFTYNGDNYDEGPFGYGSMLTKSGTLFIHSPQDSLGYKSPVGAYTYYNNAMGYTGNPSQYMDYNNYLRGKWKDGQQFTTACNARDTSGVNFTNYVMYGDPCVNGSWSEKQCNNTPADRRFIITTSDFTFTPGAELNMTFALINTPRALDTCSISLLQAMADTVMMYPNGCGSNQALAVQNILLEKSVDIYPNPTHSNLTIQWNDELKGHIESLTIVNAVGQQIFSTTSLNNNKINVNTNSYSDGMYFVHIQTKNGNMTKRFVKN